MALETDISTNESLVFSGDFSGVIENGQLLLLDKPLMLYTQENIENDCAIVLDPLPNDNSLNENLNLPEIIFDGNYFQFENLQNSNIQNDFELHEAFHYIDERQQVDDGLAVLEILCKSSKSEPDQTEFVDINNLTDSETKVEVRNENDVLAISDDDDVVFVGEYKEDEPRATEEIVEKSDKRIRKTNSSVRRNPVRKVRTRSRDLCKEHIFEEDFAFLDTTEEEDEEEEEKENKVHPKKNPPSTENFKEWPINVHERPEYNSVTNKIESFDYTIREIQKKLPNKKPRLETVIVRKKSKKKYLARRRKPRNFQEKKVPIDELKPVVDSTLKLLMDFFNIKRECKKLVNPELVNKDICNIENGLEIFKTQALLFSFVNNLDENEVVKEIDQMCLQNVTKE